jgi:hypothetical protein
MSELSGSRVNLNGLVLNLSKHLCQTVAKQPKTLSRQSGRLGKPISLADL